MKKSFFIVLVCLLVLFIGNLFAVEVTLLGPKQYIRAEGKPIVYTDNFPGRMGQGALLIRNGTFEGANRASSAIIKVNGQVVCRTNDFNLEVYELEFPVSLEENNTLSVELRSEVGSYLTIEIQQEIVNHEFHRDASIPLPGNVRGVKTGDIRDNGQYRIIAGSHYSGYVYVFKYEGGSYVEEWNEQVTSDDAEILPVAVGDINNDGKNEFLVKEYSRFWGEGNLHVFQWNGVTYHKLLEQDFGRSHLPCVIFDINNDGENELITIDEDGGYYFSVFKYNNSLNSLVKVWSIPAGDAIQISVGDIDGDGNKEAACFLPWSVPGKILIIGHNGSNYTLEAEIDSFPFGLGGGSIADFDGDGKNEIITARYNVAAAEYPIYVVEYEGSSYNIQTIYNATGGMFQINSGDIDGDGLPEASVQLNGPGALLVEFMGSGYHVVQDPYTNGVYSDVADTDMDGRTEIIGAVWYGIQIVSDISIF